MSLAALNSPPLLTGLIAQSLYLLPKMQELVSKTGSPVSFGTLKKVNLAMYTIQIIAVSMPGRMDEEVAKAMAEDKKNDKKNKASDAGMALSPSSGRTLIAPAGWAFAIWGPIFLGEAVFVIAQLFVKESSPVASLIRDVSVPFSFAHLFQSLWCATFRPKYMEGNLMYISAAALGATALSLSKANAIFTQPSAVFSARDYVIFFLPMSLHFGWTTAATLVNLNGAVATAMNNVNSDAAVAVVGHLTVISATALSMYVSIDRGSPVFAGVLSWALFAVADGMTRRIQSLTGGNAGTKTTTPTRRLSDAKTQRVLSRAGAWISAGASAFTAYQSLTLSSSPRTGYSNISP